MAIIGKASPSLFPLIFFGEKFTSSSQLSPFPFLNVNSVCTPIRYSHLDIVVTRALLLRPGTASFIGAKVAADTFIFGPVHLIAFFSWTGLASGKTWSQVKSDIVRDFIPAFVTESTVWPAVQVANFKFVPVQHQLLLVNSVCLLDSAWLSWLKYQEDAPWKQLLQSYFRRK